METMISISYFLPVHKKPLADKRKPTLLLLGSYKIETHSKLVRDYAEQQKYSILLTGIITACSDQCGVWL